jgi:hypothetical protein
MSARVEFTYSLKDQIPLSSRLCRRLYGPLTRPMLILAFLVVVAVLVVAAFFITTRYVAAEQFKLVFGLVGFLVVLAALIGFRRLNIALARRAARSGSLEGAACVLEARSEYLLWTGPNWRSEIVWSGVDLIDDGPRAVMLVFRGMGYFAPRRAFTDDAVRQAFIAACAEHMTPEARKRSGLPT